MRKDAGRQFDPALVPVLRRVPGLTLRYARDSPGWEHLDIRVGRGGHPALRDKLVRRALAYAIDKPAILEAVTDNRGEPLASPATRLRKAASVPAVGTEPGEWRFTADGPPLAFASCNPPAQTSAQATVGTPDAFGGAANSVSHLRLRAFRSLPGSPEERDILIDLGYDVTGFYLDLGIGSYSGRSKDAWRRPARRETGRGPLAARGPPSGKRPRRDAGDTVSKLAFLYPGQGSQLFARYTFDNTDQFLPTDYPQFPRNFRPRARLHQAYAQKGYPERPAK